MNIEVMRATQTWQQAGAYYVRIQAMAKQYNITLREEFDEHDTRYQIYRTSGRGFSRCDMPPVRTAGR